MDVSTNIADKAQLVSTKVLKVYKNKNKMFAISMKPKKVP